MKPKKRRTKYLTKRALTQRIGLTEGSVEDLDEIRQVLTDVTETQYSRALLIRRAIEVYRYYLEGQLYDGPLRTELARIARIKGSKGRPTKSSPSYKPLEQGI